MFCNCNYEPATELCSTILQYVCRTTGHATENYGLYYAKLQCVLCKSTAALQQITICTVAMYPSSSM